MKNARVLSGLIILLVLVFFNVPSLAQPVLKVGTFNPRTGPAAAWGLNNDRGVALCAEEWNEKGGVTVKGQKYKIELIHEDDKYRGEEAVKAVNKLIFTDKVKFIVSPIASICVMAAQPTTEANKVILIFNGYGPREILKGKPYSFRTYVPADHSAPAFFSFIHKRYPEFKTVVHIAPNNTGGWTGTQADNDACDAIGIKVLASEFFEPATQDFSPMIIRILPLKPDFVSLTGTPGAPAALIIKQARELGYKGRFVHGGIFPADEIGPVAGWENIEGFLDTSLSMEGPLCPPGLKRVGAKWVAKYGKVGFPAGGSGYNNLNVLLWGIEKANSLDTEQVREGIENLRDIEVMEGKSNWGGQEHYGIKHQLIAPVVISEIRDRKLITAGVEMAQEVPLPQKKWR